jgi:hypothetical protein
MHAAVRALHHRLDIRRRLRRAAAGARDGGLAASRGLARSRSHQMMPSTMASSRKILAMDRVHEGAERRPEVR